jgi:hypothetical protein
MPRYVILEHDHPVLHWDLMLEAGAVLRTWRLTEPPASGRAVRAESSFDHRPHYLNYEGPISGGRGRVTRWDSGTFTWTAVEPGRVVLELHGTRLQGTALLEQLSGGQWSVRLDDGPRARLA